MALKQQQVLLTHLSELSVVQQSIMRSYSSRYLITMSQRVKMTTTTVERSNWKTCLSRIKIKRILTYISVHTNMFWRQRLLLCNVTLYQNMLRFYVRARVTQSGLWLRYGLDGPDFEPRLEKEDFCSPYLSRPALGPTQPPLQGVHGLFSWGKAAGALRWPSTPKYRRGNYWIAVYLYPPPSGSSWAVLGWT
jgi:hypothetical protein